MSLKLLVQTRAEDGKIRDELLSVDTDNGEVQHSALSSAGRAWRKTTDESFQYWLPEKGMVKVGSNGQIVGDAIGADEENAGLISTSDNNRFFLAGQNKKQKQGFLALVADGQPPKTIKVPTIRTMTVDKNSKRLFYVAEHEGIILDAPRSRSSVGSMSRSARQWRPGSIRWKSASLSTRTEARSP